MVSVTSGFMPYGPLQGMLPSQVYMDLWARTCMIICLASTHGTRSDGDGLTACKRPWTPTWLRPSAREQGSLHASSADEPKDIGMRPTVQTNGTEGAMDADLGQVLPPSRSVVHSGSKHRT